MANPAKSPFDLTGKTALVTGGSRGLGKAMARGLVRAGADIFISSRSGADLKAALDDILEGSDRRGSYYAADVSKRGDVAKLAAAARAEMGHIDILINNAGVNIPEAIDAVTDEAWDRVLEVNLSSIMALTRAIVPGMKERKWGRIIHISSIMGFVSKERRNAYSATKSAVIGLAKASALELGQYGITVNCIAPGVFMTDMPMAVLSDEEKAQFAARTALGRWGEPEEMVGPMLLLASEAGSYITGHALLVDGGYLAR